MTCRASAGHYLGEFLHDREWSCYWGADRMYLLEEQWAVLARSARDGPGPSAPAA